MFAMFAIIKLCVGVISKDRHGYTWMENLSVYCLQDNIYEMK